MAEPFRLDWADEALADLEELFAHIPAAASRAERDIRRMARSGFNYGRRTTTQPRLWYWPAGKVGVYYRVSSTTLRVDARRLKALP